MRIVTCALLICLSGIANAQDQTTTPSTTDPSLPESDTAIATRNALQFADSLTRANFYAEWDTYMNLSAPSAIKYYGGKDGFKEHVISIHYRNEPKTEEKPEKLQMLTMLNDIETWQCVIEKVRESWDEGRGKVKTTTYLVGESTDNGLTWKFIDASHNSLVNVIYIMPSVFSKLEIPEGKVVYVDEVATQEAAQAEQAAKAAAAKKKPVVKKTK
ncbi:hypothetical protein A4H97_26885 [Niastella yeongjuensis]|uniref:Uncharacterized protein n=2 Tax=Niastella yeongjuensis TaxID=354355 RepID=A0A1V9F0K9_9BACT|nr:hypothetical protein A4H97_26885 [Niastella yeongjuensis]SEP44395.1 hypothetical protein SAMN05660816_06197 [Niastella yeongjuensis]